MTILHEIRCNWEIIGRQLAVKDDYLKSFEHNVAIMMKIIAVVEDPPVKNKAVAEKIFYYLLRPDIIMNILINLIRLKIAFNNCSSITPYVKRLPLLILLLQFIKSQLRRKV